MKKVFIEKISKILKPVWQVQGPDIVCHPTKEDSGTFICEMISSRSPSETRTNSFLIASSPNMKKAIENTPEVLDETIKVLTDIQDLKTVGLPEEIRQRIDNQLEAINAHLLLSELVLAASEGVCLDSALRTSLSAPSSHDLSKILEGCREK